MSLADPKGACLHSDLLPERPARGSGEWRRLDVALLVVVLLAAAVVRMAAINTPLTFDELWHLALSTGRGSPVGQFVADRIYFDSPVQTSLAGAPPFYRIWTRMDGVLHPPLYVITLRLWREAFGGSDAAAQAYSIAWSLVAIGFTFATVRLMSDRYVAAMIALAMAVARTQVHFALAVRGYEMLIGLGAIAIWLMVCVEILGPTRRRLTTLAAMTLLLLLTHYFAVGGVMAIALFGLWRSPPHRVAFIATLALGGLIYSAIWLPFALHQLDDLYTGDAFLGVDRFDAALEALWIFGTPMRLIVDAAPTTTLAGLLGIGGTIVVLATISKHQRPRAVLPLAFWLVGSIGTIAVFDVSRLTRHAFFIRYLAIATPAAFAMVASIGGLLGRFGPIAVSAAVLVMAVAVRPAGPDVMEEAPDYAQTARWLALHASPDEPLLFYDGAAASNLGDMLFLHVAHEPNFAPRCQVKVQRPLAIEAVATLSPRAWIVIAHPAEDTLAAIFRGARVLEYIAMPEGGPGRIYHVEWPR